MRKQQASLTWFYPKPEKPSPPTNDKTSSSSFSFPSNNNSNYGNPRPPTSIKPTNNLLSHNTSSSYIGDIERKNVYSSSLVKRTSSEELIDRNPAVKKKRILPNSVLPANKMRSASPSIRSFDDDDEAEKVKESKPIDIDSLEYTDKSYQLSFSQKQALEIIMTRKSIFYTGAAGTGKSYILKVFLDVIEIIGLSEKVAITAPTGVAACNIRGLTIHSWAGIGMGAEDIEELLPIVLRNQKACQRWRETEILVIDEISMLSNVIFDKLNIIGQRVRNNLAPFGGIQLILCGDFFQLPPVGLGRSFVNKNGKSSTTGFAFDSDVWKEIFGDFNINSSNPSANNKKKGKIILLDKVFRQKDDLTFLNILNSLRKGQPTQETSKILIEKVRETNRLEEQEKILFMQEQAGLLESTTVKEESSGNNHYQHSQSQLPSNKSKKLKQQPAEEEKVRPTKLFSVNQDVDNFNLKELEKLHEGSDPKIFLSIDDGRDPYLAQLKNGTKAPQQLSLKIGAQVMLLKNLNTESGLVNGARGTVIGFEKSNGRTPYYPMIPVVKFKTLVGGIENEETITIIHDTWEVKSGDKTLASRIQLPLILAWAISIHKAQGMTIPWLEVSFNRMFEYGQAYVALSRATCLKGLRLQSFQSNSVRAHPRVIQFYEWLEATKRINDSQQSEIICEVWLSDFIALYRPIDSDEPDYDQWLESRNVPSTKNLVEDDWKTSKNNEADDWLERPRIPLKSLPNAGNQAPPPLPPPFPSNNNAATNNNEEEERIRQRIEGNRQAALKKLEAKRLEQHEQTQPLPPTAVLQKIEVKREVPRFLHQQHEPNKALSNNKEKEKEPVIVKEYRPKPSTPVPPRPIPIEVIELSSDDSNPPLLTAPTQATETFKSPLLPADQSNLNLNLNHPPSSNSMTFQSIQRNNNNTNIYGEFSQNNNTSIKALALPDELKRKIEENRLAALKKLEYARKRSDEEMRKVMDSYNL